MPDAVFYHIFVDRFRRSGGSSATLHGNISPRTPHGGNLTGIIEAIPYLRDLGVNTLYLTPIFRAASYHKYDTIDYFTMDPAFGTNEDLDQRVRELHRSGMRLVLDGVFNHCSDQHPFFLDAQARGRRSEYWNWFDMNGGGDALPPQPGYRCWAGVPKMPEWNHENPDVVQYLLSVVRYWIEQHRIDGWRLDTTEYLPPDFTREIYRTVKSANPECYVLGEVMGLATSWFRHQALDGVMHYRLWEGCVRLFAHGACDPQTFVSELYKLWNSYPEDCSYGSLTLLSSHDKPRFLSQCGGDVRRLVLALVFQFTFPGAPCVYYGDEIGLRGGDDPDNRRPFPWSEELWDHRILDQVKTLVKLRAESTALRRGAVNLYRADDHLLSYIRSHGTKQVLIALNLNPDQNIVLPLPEGKWTGWNSEQVFGQELAVPALAYRILQKPG